jgi:hypothetical protein
MTSSKKLEAVTNLRAIRTDLTTGSLKTNMIYVYFNIPNININEINSFTIRHKPYTQYYTVSFISKRIDRYDSSYFSNMRYEINTSNFKDDNGNDNLFGNGYGYQWVIQVTYTMNNGEESETATIISERYT